MLLVIRIVSLPVLDVKDGVTGALSNVKILLKTCEFVDSVLVLINGAV